ncbi:MAG: selenoprotein O and cysteine-containing protein, partial [Pseudomonadales bacterium 32-42-5]
WLNNLIPLCPQDYDKEQWKQDLADCLEHYEPTFLEHYKLGLSQKMGLPHFHTDSFDCAMTFLRILQTEQLDYTQSFTRLQEQQYEMIKDDCLDRRQFESFLAQYEQIRANQDTTALDAAMQQANPVYILRNHMAQKAIELAERNDFSEVERLFDLLSRPFERNVALEKAEDLAPLPTDVPEVMVSCSS